MTVDDANQFLNPLGFAALGTILGTVLNKIFSTQDKHNLYIIFYGFSFISAIVLVWTAVATKGSAITFIWWFTLSCTVALTIVTALVLKTKDKYRTAELDPVINKFTEKADRQFINLLCGDMNFFGSHPAEMDKNSQYTFLRSSAFNKIYIMCYAPANSSDRIRYGKLLTDMPQAELRYYHPNKANLSLRGRITRQQGVDKLLMYFKLSGQTYQAIETDKGTSAGALYSGIWDLIWDLGQQPAQQDLDNFKQLANS